MTDRKRAPTTTQTPGEIGFRAPKKTGGGQRRAGESRVDSSGRRVYVAPTIPDPGIQHGPFKVLERTDGPFVIFDTRAKPGQGTVEIFTSEDHANPKRAAELRAIELAASAAD